MTFVVVVVVVAAVVVVVVVVVLLLLLLLLLLGLIILDIAKTESSNCFSANQKGDSNLYGPLCVTIRVICGRFA